MHPTREGRSEPSSAAIRSPHRAGRGIGRGGETHVHRYLTEFAFRYNRRSGLGIEDTERAADALKGIYGKRLTYRSLDEGTHAYAEGAQAVQASRADSTRTSESAHHSISASRARWQPATLAIHRKSSDHQPENRKWTQADAIGSGLERG